MPRIAIVILNWNTESYLLRFLPGVLRSAGWLCSGGAWEMQPGSIAEVMVADSHSSDGSMKLMAEQFPRVRTIPLDDNYGFTGGYNRALEAIRHDGFDYYILLNSDIEADGKWIEPLLEFMDGNPSYGACAPKLHGLPNRESFEYAGAAGGYIDRMGYPFCRGRIMGKVEKDEGQYEDADVFWASGACLMVRSELYHGMGGLDDRFFAHMEEIDLCWRMQLEGWKIRVLTGPVLYHLGGGTLPAGSPFKTRLNFRNNLLMLSNNLAKALAVKELHEHGGEPGKIARKAIRKAERRIFWRKILDFFSGIVYLLGGKWSWFWAIYDAHCEFDKMRARIAPEELEEWLVKSPREELGLIYPGLMIPVALLRGKEAFKKLSHWTENK